MTLLEIILVGRKHTNEHCQDPVREARASAEVPQGCHGVTWDSQRRPLNAEPDFTLSSCRRRNQRKHNPAPDSEGPAGDSLLLLGREDPRGRCLRLGPGCYGTYICCLPAALITARQIRVALPQEHLLPPA